jgi:hypothetical protein
MVLLSSPAHYAVEGGGVLPEPGQEQSLDRRPALTNLRVAASFVDADSLWRQSLSPAT